MQIHPYSCLLQRLRNEGNKFMTNQGNLVKHFHRLQNEKNYRDSLMLLSMQEALCPTTINTTTVNNMVTINFIFQSFDVSP